MEILKNFTKKDSSDWMNEIHKINEHIYATDAVIAIRKKGVLKTPASHEITKHAKNMLLDVFNEKIFDKRVFKTDDVKAQIKEMEKIPYYNTEKEECGCCDGYGEVEYEFSFNGKNYDKMINCPVCSGEGEIKIKSRKISGYEISKDAEFKVFDNKHVAVIQCIKILDLAHEIEVFNTEKNFIICKAADFEIIIMGKLITEGQEENVFVL